MFSTKYLQRERERERETEREDQQCCPPFVRKNESKIKRLEERQRGQGLTSITFRAVLVEQLEERSLQTPEIRGSNPVIVNCIQKILNKEKEAWNGPFFNFYHFFSKWTILCLFFIYFCRFCLCTANNTLKMFFIGNLPMTGLEPVCVGVGSNRSVNYGATTSAKRQSLPPEWLFGGRGHQQCDQKELPNVYKSCPKMISLEKW